MKMESIKALGGPVAILIGIAVIHGFLVAVDNFRWVEMHRQGYETVFTGKIVRPVDWLILAALLYRRRQGVPFDPAALAKFLANEGSDILRTISGNQPAGSGTPPPPPPRRP